MKAFVLFIALTSACAAPAKTHPWEHWKWYDYTLEGTFAVTLVADYVQTLQIIENGTEGNPLIGAHGERIHPNVYFPAAFILHAGGLSFFKRELRLPIQMFSIVIQSVTVWNNWVDGFKFL